MIRHKVAALLAALASASLLWGPAAHAQSGADLSISPKRIVFGQSSRAATLYVINRGAEAATYGLALSDQVMTPDGQIRPAAELATAPEASQALARLKSAKELVSFSPRRITLQPGESQTVRLRALRPAELAQGEYRTHLVVTAVPPEDVGFTAEQAAASDEGQLSVKIVTLFSIGVPVIVRQGPEQVSAKIENLQFQAASASEKGAAKAAGMLSLDLVREGEASLYGDVEVRKLKGGKPGDIVGGVRGLGVYSEIDRRKVTVRLASLPAAGEKLQVVFRDDDARPGTVLATADFVVP